MTKGLKELNKIKELNILYDIEMTKNGEEYMKENDINLNIIEEELEEYQQHEEILNDYGLTLANFREACLLLAMLKGEGRTIHNIDKQLELLEILKAFEFEIEDYTEHKNGSIKVNCRRIILDNDEIDLAKKVLL